MNRSARFFALVAAAVIGALIWYASGARFNLPGMERLGAGEPLGQSTAQINVLEEASPLAEPSTTLPTSTRVGIPAPQPVPPATFNDTAAQLGTTISLLVSNWPMGGNLPHQLALAADKLADATGQPAVASAASALVSATPREGPITMHLVMVETARVLQFAPPENLPADDAAAQAGKSWFRQQLEKIVSIRSTPATQNSWHSALLLVQQQLARNAVTDAMQTLTSSPLDDDLRLADLRALCKGYLSQTGKLNNLVTAYTNTYLNKEED